jgi:4-diphosphocytidyl-2-C-methyl-D-erythritol kinase
LQKPIPGVPEQEDLTVRAANLLKQISGCEQGVCIEVDKILPMGGGLGGGSSDAATTLVVLNRLWGLDFSLEKLMEIGLKLGADVPVFVYGYTAWGEGVGEKLQAIEVPEKWLVIIKPDCHVNTKEIFSAKDLTRDSKPIKMTDFLEGDGRNDCTVTVCKQYPQVKVAMQALSEYSEAKLTGTGACVFAQFLTEFEATNAYAALKNEWEVYLTKGLNISPLHNRFKQG